MALSTFGAIMNFALEKVGYSVNIYKSMVQKAKDSVLKETLQLLLDEEIRNDTLMEQTRRENVTEMILEPITGLEQEDYEITVDLPKQAKDIDLLKVALVLEEKERNFFSDSSAKIPLPEVARTFRKVAQKKEKTLAKLKALGLNQSFGLPA
jgi:rubrerythrin